MKSIGFTNRHGVHAFGRIELVVIVGTLVLLIFLLFVGVRRNHSREADCQNNLRQIGMAFREWSFNADKYPMACSTNKGGTKELIEAGQVYPHFRAMSNELRFANLLVCPADQAKLAAPDFASVTSDLNVSYFVGVDTADEYPQTLLSGDRNLACAGEPLNPGLFRLNVTNVCLSWTEAIHKSKGYICLADGSVRLLHRIKVELGTYDQRNPTNRLAIP